MALVAVTALAAACAPPPSAPAPGPAAGTPALSACAPSAAAAIQGQHTPPDDSDRGLTLVAVDGGGRPEIVTTDAAGAATAVASLEAQPDVDVLALEVDQPVSTEAVPAGDPYRPNQWGLDALQVETAWAGGRGAGTDIAVVDSGVLGTHRDLAGRVCTGVAFLGSTGVAQVGQGATDANGHGTHVAGIAAAGAGDAVGVAGVAPAARIIPVRVLDGSGTGSSSDVARGITWAVDHGAEVINISLGGPYSFAVDAAVDYAESHGVLVVAAAGNAGPTGPPNYPAALPAALAVASHDEGGAISWYSTRGAYVDVAAPGSGIMSTYKDGRWTYMSGTSMATPHVAGAAALLVAADPDRTPAELRALLQDSATDAGPIGHDTDYGWGRIDLVGALNG